MTIDAARQHDMNYDDMMRDSIRWRRAIRYDGAMKSRALMLDRAQEIKTNSSKKERESEPSRQPLCERD
eukprot:CAMPEP_0172520618 /NCGR_PEP_ID=MMETSP1066-20121228/292111_1 /TAXON_ID=671091 /ORGANISM="Coscinodiscus wailesii, Strain CCMP2513" /LENGTH=68 /DNA_ID=CAMNT_0013303411 /DNA_START=682 /DNA_END=889 /DNA_ORIENTATION=-